MSLRGVLLINIGTPESSGTGPKGDSLPPGVSEVRSYLREFLMDPKVIDLAFPLRWFVVNRMILPKRASASQKLYEGIWTKDGSPLLVYSREFVAKLQERLGAHWGVEVGMRYGNPSIKDALARLRNKGVAEVLVLPLFPQYAEATTGSALAALNQELMRFPDLSARILPSFYEDEGFVQAFAEQVRLTAGDSVLPWDAVVFSFHGLPERQKGATRYRRECVRTAEAIAERLSLSPDQRVIGFQSRLGKGRWLGPETNDVLSDLAGKQVKRIAVVCPSFVADCLETIEEIGVRAKEDFIAMGGEELVLVPSLNASEQWVKAVTRMVQSA